MVNKGGCKVGKKAPEGTPKGGCKEGLKAPKKKKLVVVGPVDTMVATKKTKVQQPAQKAKVIAAKPRVAKVAKVVTMPKKKRKLVVKKKAEPKPSIGKKLTGLSKEEMNKLSPLELFGKLPVSVSKMVLSPSVTGVKVAKEKEKALEEEVERLLPKFKAIKDREMSKKWGSVKQLREQLDTDFGRKHGYSGYKKSELIDLITDLIAEKEIGLKKVRDALYNVRREKRDKKKTDEVEKRVREIKEAKPIKPTDKQMAEYRHEKEQRRITLNMMRGPSYASTREESNLRFNHKYRNIIAYLKSV